MIEAGDWVWPKLESRVRLVLGGRDYHFALVLSLEPLVLISQTGNARWHNEDINEFERMI